ncbi:hypothetical protein MCUN1_000333 [Malassezia cuniculi]|uniref:G-patch domain-containing protein n=1 Tax=Malassezia cuniculi TaxID=948313 RepID=A0AAF0ENT7_9BASI|nr:hypothetical protein MCUN1_000333 [Malassezia cuniculi]
MVHRLGTLGGAKQQRVVATSSKPAKAPSPPPSKYKLRPSNRGYSMLASMGWQEGMGLGREESKSEALINPLPIVIKNNRMGIGRRTLVHRGPGAAPKPSDAPAEHPRPNPSPRPRPEILHESQSVRMSKRQRAQREKDARDEWLALRASLK